MADIATIISEMAAQARKQGNTDMKRNEHNTGPLGFIACGENIHGGRREYPWLAVLKRSAGWHRDLPLLWVWFVLTLGLVRPNPGFGSF